MLRRRVTGRVFCTCTAAIGTLLPGSAVHAQQAPSLEGDNIVLSRPRPGLDPSGFAVGGFTVFPSVDARVAYDDNVYETARDTVSSPILTVSPDLSVRSSWGRHALNLDASGTFERFTSRPSENNDRYKIQADGRLDLLDWLQLGASAHAIRSIEARGTAGDIFSAGEPIRFRNDGGTFGLTAQLTDLRLTASGEVDRITYDDARVGGVEISQAYRNRVYSEGTLNVSYDVSPSLQPFLQLEVERQRYDQRARDTSLDSSGVVVLGGFNISLTKLLTGRVGAGYRWRNYRNPSYTDSRGFTYDIALLWNPRTLLAVTVEAQKAIDESPNPVASGIVRNEASIRFDYEILRNLILQAATDYTVEKYRGISRVDHRITSSIDLQYLMNRNIRVDLRYDLSRQDGSGAFGRSYRGNVIGLALTLQR